MKKLFIFIFLFFCMFVNTTDINLLDWEQLTFGTTPGIKMYWDSSLEYFRVLDSSNAEIYNHIKLGDQFWGGRYIQNRSWDAPIHSPLLDFYQMGSGENCIRFMHSRANPFTANWMVGIPVQQTGQNFALFNDYYGSSISIEDVSCRVLISNQFGFASNWDLHPNARLEVRASDPDEKTFLVMGHPNQSNYIAIADFVQSNQNSTLAIYPNQITSGFNQRGNARLHTITDRRLSVNEEKKAFQHDSILPVNVQDWITIHTLSTNETLGRYTRGTIKCKLGGHNVGYGNGTLDSDWYFDINNGVVSVGEIQTVQSGIQPRYRLNVVGNSIQIQIASYNATYNFVGTCFIDIFAPQDNTGNLLYTLE